MKIQMPDGHYVCHGKTWRRRNIKRVDEIIKKADFVPIVETHGNQGIGIKAKNEIEACEFRSKLILQCSDLEEAAALIKIMHIGYWYKRFYGIFFYKDSSVYFKGY